MKTLLTAMIIATLATATSFADPTSVSCDPCTPIAPHVPAPIEVSTTQAAPTDSEQAAPTDSTQPAKADSTQPSLQDDSDGWHRPAGQRFTSGFRLGWMYVANWDALNRKGDDGQMTSLKAEYGLKSPSMFLIGYEGFYRVLSHSWLNVLIVGNFSVAGLDQSKFIPTGSGLLGFEINRRFELGAGINLTPDPQSPSHMIVAAGWTPRIGSIQTPVHFFYIPDPAGTDANGNHLAGNNRMGATIGMNW